MDHDLVAVAPCTLGFISHASLRALTQEQISEALDITPVHANRIIRQLRDDGIVDINRGRVTVLDETKLADLAQFDDRYLHQDPSA